jgi:hypothetical protein
MQAHPHAYPQAHPQAYPQAYSQFYQQAYPQTLPQTQYFPTQTANQNYQLFQPNQQYQASQSFMPFQTFQSSYPQPFSYYQPQHLPFAYYNNENPFMIPSKHIIEPLTRLPNEVETLTTSQISIPRLELVPFSQKEMPDFDPVAKSRETLVTNLLVNSASEAHIKNELKMDNKRNSFKMDKLSKSIEKLQKDIKR